MTRGIPVDLLERQAEEQRARLENHVLELRRKVRHRLDVKQNLRSHLWTAVGTMVVLGAVLGYAVAGIFTKD